MVNNAVRHTYLDCRAATRMSQLADAASPSKARRASRPTARSESIIVLELLQLENEECWV